MNTAHKLIGPPTNAVLQLVFKSETVPDLGFDPEKLLLHDYPEAIAWHNSLAPDDILYLTGIDKFVATLPPGETVDLIKKVKPENKVKFYRCLFYVLMGCNMLNAVSFSADFSLLRLNETWQPQ